MWKGQHNGQDVAAKALRVCLASDFERIRKVGCPRFVVFINEMTAPPTEVLQGSRSMENVSSPERGAAVRRDDDRE